MSTGAITNYTGNSTNTNAAGQSSATGETVSENQFLDLLVTQLQNQDPTQPMDDSQFVSELAQFSSLQESTTMNTTVGLQTAAGMIGATITSSADDSSGNPISGEVTSASSANGVANVIVGTNTVPLTDITAVSYPSVSNSSSSSSGS
jgi:flagellar basal-body rod modification protein FlgD